MASSPRGPAGAGPLLRNPMVAAGATALVVSVVLVLAVWVTWTSAGGGAPAAPDSAALSALDVPTPTPRAIRRSTAAVTAVAPTVAPAGRPAPTATQAARPAPTATPAPRPAADEPEAADAGDAPATEIAVAGGIEIPTAKPAATEAAPASDPQGAESEPEPTVADEDAPLVDYGDGDSFGPLVAGNWQLDGELLVFGGTTGQAEPWLTIPAGDASGDYAVEVEMRAKELVQGFCNQNFGVAAGSAAGGTVWGAGVLYPCDDAPPLARLTDVTEWANGYDSDRELAAERFDPKNDWHVFRFEVRGTDLTLLIDGEEVVAADDSQAVATGGDPIQIGVWSQGVRALVREVAVYAL